MSLLVAKTGRSSVRELTLNCVSITNSAALSNTFNDHFSTIGSKLASEIPFNNGSSFQEHISGLCERFQLVSTDSNQVLCLFKKLNKPKGAGLDGISSRLILDCADLIAPQISIIFNSSLANGIFSDDWKSARVTPLFKHGERSDIDNYRQISVISIIGKVFERIIYNQLFAFLSDHNILSKHQSGYLDNRTQKCVVNDSLSECCTFKCGIPQATILGLNCFCHISMICPTVCLALCQECMLMLPI